MDLLGAQICAGLVTQTVGIVCPASWKPVHASHAACYGLQVDQIVSQIDKGRDEGLHNLRPGRVQQVLLVGCADCLDLVQPFAKRSVQLDRLDVKRAGGSHLQMLLNLAYRFLDDVLGRNDPGLLPLLQPLQQLRHPGVDLG